MGNWSQHYDYIYNTVSEEIDKTLFRLAIDFGLIERKALPNEPDDPGKNKPTPHLADTQNTSSASTEEKGEELGKRVRSNTSIAGKPATP
jgi:hypothetical protein